MKKHSLKTVALAFAALACMIALTVPSATLAQDTPAAEENETNLKDIFESDPTKNKDNRPKNGKEMAYEFYEKCTTSPDFFVAEKTQKNYCACKAAKMEETMTPKEMAALEDDTREGKAARDKMRMNADANCMRDAALTYTYGICMKDPHFREIILGKSSMCRCVRDLVARRTRRDLPNIIIKAATQEPLSTNPLSFYLRSPDYDQLYSLSKEHCYTKMVYEDVKNK
ncbi:MAG: hypothetical protein KJ017_03665 [Alphaproteobacteria bacterium]|nr:hypothetical protein [Alphaproteobacteria bacterium]